MTPSLTITRTFNAPRERVFAAFTDAAQLRHWWGPPGTSIRDVAFDARDGGRYRIVMIASSGEDYVAHGTITEFRPPERLAYTFEWEEDDPKDVHQTHVAIDFIDRGRSTDMIFFHDGFASEESRANHEGGWNGIFGKLDAALRA